MGWLINVKHDGWRFHRCDRNLRMYFDISQTPLLCRCQAIDSSNGHMLRLSQNAAPGLSFFLWSIIMHNPENAMTDTCRNQLDASRQLAQTVLTCTEKMDQTLLRTAHALFMEQTRFAQALINSRDPKQIVLLQSSFFSHTPECVTKSQKD
ncbi:MAG: phasin family protein, partial [Oxalobacteraceae bacterium]